MDMTPLWQSYWQRIGIIKAAFAAADIIIDNDTADAVLTNDNCQVLIGSAE